MDRRGWSTAREPLTDLCDLNMLICMRTTLQLDDALMRDTKRAALESGRTLTAVVEDALRQALSRRKKSGRRRPVKFTTFGGNGPLPVCRFSQNGRADAPR